MFVFIVHEIIATSKVEAKDEELFCQYFVHSLKFVPENLFVRIVQCVYGKIECMLSLLSLLLLLLL